jgi:hypothetical protein
MTTEVRATKREMRLYREWQTTQARVQMALQTLYGAQGAVIQTEVAFKAAVQLKHGPKATFEYSEKGLVFILPAQPGKKKGKK